MDAKDAPGLFGVPELHTLPEMLATRTRVAQAEEVCWRGGRAATPAHLLRPLEQGAALRGQREQRVH